ncbi:MAG: enolase C-terminal domain-like protein [Planctomycetaceae bacterium]
MKIQHVRVTHLDTSIWGFLAEREKTLPLVTPLDIYKQYRETRGSWFWDSGCAVVEIVADDGTAGTGWCEDGCQAIKPIIDNHLSRLLLGENPSEVEGIWDRLFRASIPYGRKGAALEAISAIDIALWDLMGHAAGKPVYELLGGSIRKTLPVYASALHPVEPLNVCREAEDYVEQGYTAMKTRFPCGPGDGSRGMAENEAHIARIRETIGDDVDLMADAYMGWDFYYAVRMCQRLEKYRLAWLEEPFLPDDLISYAKLRKETPIPLSGGEHEFTRYGFQQIIDREAMDILQPDLRRCGGFTEARKIAALAAASGLTVIPHAYCITHLHFAAATPNIPMVEYFPLPCWAEPAPSTWKPLFVDEPVPANAKVTLSDKPGLGMRLNVE